MRNCIDLKSHRFKLANRLITMRHYLIAHAASQRLIQRVGLWIVFVRYVLCIMLARTRFREGCHQWVSVKQSLTDQNRANRIPEMALGGLLSFPSYAVLLRQTVRPHACFRDIPLTFLAGSAPFRTARFCTACW